MQGKERVLKSLGGEPVDRLPVLCVNQTATYEQMEQLQSYWPEANYQAREMARLASGAFSILGFDAVRVPFCQTIEAEALGCKIKDGGKINLPSPQTHPYKIDDIPELPSDYLERCRIPVLIDALKKLKEAVGDGALVIGGVIGPFSITGSLLGVTDILRHSFKKPHALQPFLEVSEKAGRLLARELIAAGADLICIEDMMASLDLISPKIYREVVLPWQQKLVAGLQDIPTIMHICGKLDDVIEDVAGLGVTAISVEESVDAPAAIKKLSRFNRFIALIGGINAPKTLYSGDVGKVVAETRKAVENGYHMVAPGCSIPPATPIGSLRAMVETVSSLTSTS
ncbi:MAG: MtaA/CmuA family methyltransferase [Eubacteriales bacterium]